MGTYYSPRIVTDGLVLCLDAANPKSYPGSGTTWSDLSKNGNNGTLTNGPTYSGDNKGYITLDGVNDYINMGDLDFESTFSMSIWFRGRSASSTFCGIFCKDQTGNLGAGGLFADSANNYVRFGFIDSTITQHEVSNSSFTDVRSNIWVNYCGTYDLSDLKLYRNGTLIASVPKTQTPVTNNVDLAIGYRAANSRYFGADIGYAWLYNKALSADEVVLNFQATRGRYGI